MKRILLFLALLPSLCFGAAYDFGMDQRSPANNSWEKRLLASPASAGVMVYDPVSRLTSWNTLGSGLQASSGVLSVTLPPAVTWDNLTGKPDLAPVATSNAYADLTGKPAIPAAQVASDWNATTGLAAILNKPNLFSGVYADLTGKPSLFSGAYADLTGKPTIPAAQVPSDWSATSGPTVILNKPAIPGPQVQSDWNATSSPAAILNKPVLFSGAYSALTGVPSSFTPSAHSQPWSTITATPTTLSGYGITDGLTASALGSYATTSALNSALAGKYNTPAGTASQYVRGDGTLATLPTARRIETYTGTTNAQGQVIVVYPTAFAAAPVVQPPAPATANQVWTTVSSTATGFTLQLNQRNSINLLNADVLLGATVPVAGTVAQFLVVAP